LIDEAEPLELLSDVRDKLLDLDVVSFQKRELVLFFASPEDFAFEVLLNEIIVGGKD
jgi:hypothetical protein